jgi:hypothetical protein
MSHPRRLPADERRRTIVAAASSAAIQHERMRWLLRG